MSLIILNVLLQIYKNDNFNNIKDEKFSKKTFQ